MTPSQIAEILSENIRYNNGKSIVEDLSTDYDHARKMYQRFQREYDRYQSKASANERNYWSEVMKSISDKMELKRKPKY